MTIEHIFVYYWPPEEPENTVKPRRLLWENYLNTLRGPSERTPRPTPMVGVRVPRPRWRPSCSHKKARPRIIRWRNA